MKMLNAKSASFAVAIAAMGAVFNASAASTGTVNVTGRVTQSTCVVATTGVTVALPAIDQSVLVAQANIGGTTGFVINVTGCDAAMMVSARFAPDGNTTTGGNLRNLTTEGGTSASVQILDNDRRAINIQTDDETTAATRRVAASADGAASLQYYAQYYAESANTTVGALTASANFTLTYQ